jgi:hypothetical protein
MDPQWRWGRTGYSPGPTPAAREPPAIASLIATARLNGLDPEAYLRHVLGRIATHPARRIGELLPWNCASLIAMAQEVRRAA